MAGFEFDDRASGAIFGGSAADTFFGGQSNRPVGLPATPVVPDQVQQRMQQRQEVYAQPRPQQQAAPTVGFNPSTMEVFLDGKVLKLDDTVPMMEALQSGSFNNTQPLPPGFNVAQSTDIAQYVQSTINEPGFVSTLKRSGAQMGGGVGEIYGDVTGNYDNALSHASNNVIARNPSGINSLEDIVNNPGLAVREAGGMMLGFAGPQVGLRGAGLALQGLKMARTGAAVGGFGAQAGMAALPSLHGIGESQRENGVDGEWWATPAKYAGAAAVGAIEQRFGPQDLLNRAMKGTLVKELGATPWRTAGRLTAQGMLGEAGEELVQNPIEQGAAGENPLTPGNLEQTAFGGAMGGIGGALGGGAFGAAYGYGQHRRNKIDAANKMQEQSLIEAARASQVQPELLYPDNQGAPGAGDNYRPPIASESHMAGANPNQMQMFDQHGYVHDPANANPLPHMVETNQQAMPTQWQEEQNWFASQPEAVGREVPVDQRAGEFVRSNPALQQASTNPYTLPLFSGNDGGGSFGAGDNQRAQALPQEPYVHSFDAYRNFSQANAQGDAAGAQAALDQAAAITGEHQQPYNSNQGVLPLQNSVDTGWAAKAQTAFNAARAKTKGAKSGAFNKALKEANSSADMARALRKLAFGAANGQMIDLYDAAHKALTGYSFEEYQEATHSSEEQRDKLLEDLTAPEKETLAHALGWGMNEKASSDAGIAVARGVREATVNNTWDRIVAKLKTKIGEMGLSQDEFIRLIGARAGSSLWDTQMSDEERTELGALFGANQNAEDTELSRISQDGLQTNATLGASETGTKRGETLYNRVAPEGRAWEDLTDLEKQHVTALSKSVSETPEGQVTHEVTKGEVKKTSRQSVEAIAQEQVGEYAEEVRQVPDRNAKPEIVLPEVDNENLTTGVPTALEDVVRKDATPQDIKDAAEEWDSTKVEGDPGWAELALDEQKAFVNMYVAYYEKEKGALAPHQQKGRIVDERTKPGAQGGTGKAVAAKDAAASSEAKDSGAKKEIPPPREHPEREPGEVKVTKGKKAQKFRKRAGGQAAGLSVSTVQDVVSRVTAKWKNAPTVVVHENGDGVAGYAEGDKGFIDENDVVHIFANNAASPADVVATLYHEAKGHYGLAGAYGEALGGILDEAYAGNAQLRKAADVVLVANGWPSDTQHKRMAVEEALSERQVMQKVPGIMSKIKAAIAKIARSMGMYRGFSDAEIEAILQRATEYVEAGGKKAPRGEVQKRSAATVAAKETLQDAAIDVGGWVRRGSLAFREMAQIVREFKDRFGGDTGPLTSFAKHVRLQGTRAKEYLDEARDTVDKLNALGPEDKEKLGALLNQSTLHGYALHEPITNERNNWMLEAKKNAETDESVEDINETLVRFHSLQAAYKKAPSIIQELYKSVDKVTTNMLRAQVKNNIGAYLETYRDELNARTTAANRAEFEKLSFDPFVTTKELTTLRSKLRDIFKDDKAAQRAINEMNRQLHDKLDGLHQRRGVYMPLMRFGDWVVVARSKEFIEQEKEVDELKAGVAAFKADSDAMQRKTELSVAAAEARYHAFRSKLSQEGYKEAKRQLSEFKKTPEYVADVTALREQQKELRKETKKLGKMARDEAHFNVHKFERESQAVRAKEQYAAKGMDAYEKRADIWVGGMDTVSTSFSKKLADRLKKRISGDDDQSSALRNSVEQNVKRIFVETQHDQSSLYRMAMRRSISGYNKDVGRVFQSFLLQGAHRLSAQEYFFKVQKAVDDVRDMASKSDKGDSGRLTEVANELAKRRHLDLEYKETPYQDAVARLNQVMVLGMSPGYIMQQVMQPFMLSVPFLFGRRGASVSGVTGAMWDGWRDAWKLVRLSGEGSGLARAFPIKLENNGLSDTENEALKYLADLGQLDILMDHDISIGAQGKAANKYDRFLEMSSWVARQTETVNRISTGLAAYRMELARLQKEGDPKAHQKAMEYAAEAVEQTQVDYANENAARLTKRNAFPMSKLIMQFKKYQFHMIQMLVWNAKQAYKGDKEAMKILSGILSTHLLMAGTLGLPIAAPLVMVAQVFSWMGADDDEVDPETAYKNFLADVLGKDVADVAARGIFASLGVDLSRKLGLGNMFSPVPFVRTDKEGKDQFNDLIVSLLGPSASTAGRMVDGASALADGKYQEAWTKMLPKYMTDPIKAYKQSEEGITTKQGNVRIPAEKLDTADVIMIGMGIPTLKVNKYYEYTAAFEDMKAAANRVSTDLKKQWVKGDAEEKAETMETIREFNARHPTRAITMRDLFQAKRADATYQKGVTEDGIKVGKKDKEFAEALRY